MTDRPIIFSAPMVRALLDGRKTQTRRVMKPQPEELPNGFAGCRLRYAPGDRLYVRESIARQETDQGIGYQTFAADGRQVWPLTEWYHKRTSIPSIHMPRWASRMTLTVTEVRVQRLNEISAQDSIAEGVQCSTCQAMQQSACHDRGCFASRLAFKDLWNSLHGADAWDANPWVVALTFTVRHGNIDT